MTRIAILSTIFLIYSAGVLFAADDNHPLTYIDEGACPFECCTYQEWSVRKSTDIYKSPDEKSKTVSAVKIGSKVVAVTGFVKVDSPGKIEVVREFKEYKKGDIVWVYAYIGEGFFKVWFGGKMYEEDVSFLLHGINGSFVNCVKKGTCWGKVINKPETTWWIKIRNKEGIEGWSNKPQNFGNKDSCS